MTIEIDQVRLTNFKSQVRQHWNKLSEDDVSRINNNAEDLVAILRKKYGYGKAQAEIEIGKWLDEVLSQRQKPK